MYYTILSTQLCDIILVGDDQGLSRIHLATPETRHPLTLDPTWQRNDTALSKARTQLAEYFTGTRTSFDLPLAPQGTEFQVAVWQELARIPHGTTCSYGDIAAAIGKPSASRAVGGAVGKNPLPLIYPCHRVIGASGALTGFDPGLEAKKFLLRLEGVME